MADTPVAADLRFMREVNATAVLERLRRRDRMSVAELAKASGLSRQAVTRSLTELRDAGLVEYLPPERDAKRSGRPAQLVRFRARAGYVVGAFIDPHQIRLGLADLRGEMVTSRQAVLEHGADGEAAIALMVQEVQELLAQAGTAPEQVYSAAIGAPGIVDPTAGVIRLVPSMSGLSGDGVVRALGEYLDCAVYLDNDVKLATRGEQWHGVRRDDESLVVVHWGERIGAGIVLNGSLYRGATNDAGDLGFLDVIAEGGHGTTDSGLGRFEAWAGASALTALAVEEMTRSGDAGRAQQVLDAGDDALELVLAAIQAGDRDAGTALVRVAERFAIGLAAIRTLLDPHLVVFSGPLARVGEPLLEALRAALVDFPLELPELQVSTLGADAVVQGGIRHCLDELEQNRYVPLERGARP